MSDEWRYPIEIRAEAGEFRAYCEDLPEARAAGVREGEALREMRGAIVPPCEGA